VRILIVEDNKRLAVWLAKLLRGENYAVDCVYTGEDAETAIDTMSYDLMVVDLGLPKKSGLEVIKYVRGRAHSAPILILTADDAVKSRVAGLDMGADDYLAKPFEVSELEARLRALLRRAGTTVRSEIACGPLVLDHNSRAFSLRGSPLHLSPKEHALLETLLRRAGTTVSKAALLESIYGFDDDVGPGAIEIYVHRLRRKLEDSPVRIATLRGLGYLLRLEER
jgi:two-component system response regulator TctD